MKLFGRFERAGVGLALLVVVIGLIIHKSVIWEVGIALIVGIVIGISLRWYRFYRFKR